MYNRSYLRQGVVERTGNKEIKGATMANRDKILTSFSKRFKTQKMRSSDQVGEVKGKKRRDFRREMSERKWQDRLGNDDE